MIAVVSAALMSFSPCSVVEKVGGRCKCWKDWEGKGHRTALKVGAAKKLSGKIIFPLLVSGELFFLMVWRKCAGYCH